MILDPEVTPRMLARPGDEADATRTREHVARARRRVTQGTETPPHRKPRVLDELILAEN